MANSSVVLPVAAPRRADSPFAVVLVALALAAVAIAVYFLWLPTAPFGSLAAEHYFPLPRGAAFTYRVSNPDGSISYRTRNVARDPANVGASALNGNIFVALTTAARLDVEKMTPVEMVGILNRVEYATIHELAYDSAGKTTGETRTFILLDGTGIQQFGINEIGITPPVPILPSGNDAQTLELKLNGQVPATVTQQIVKRDAYRTALGEFSDCIQVQTSVLVGDNTSNGRTWYCAGIGEVYDETTDAQGTKRAEIIAASVGTNVRGSAPVFPDVNLNSDLQFQFDAPLAATPSPQLEYKEPTDSKGITTNILPVQNVPLRRAATAIAGSGDLLLYGTQSGKLVAVDRASEREVWSFQTGDAIYSTPIVHQGIVYFGSAGKKVYAVRVNDGAFVWAFQTNDIVSASPAAQGNAVYIASEDRTLYALDANTGKARWAFTSSSALVAPPVVHDDRVLASNDDGVLYALNATTGQLLWTFAANQAIAAPVTVADGVVYFGAYDQNVYALNLRDGSMLWAQEVDDYAKYAVLVHAKRVYVTLPSEVFALDAASGNPLWHFKSDRALKATPVRTGNQLWFLRTGDLIAVEAATGARLAQIPVTTGSTNAGLTSDGRELFIGFFDGELKSFAGTLP
ncbi:MAG: PQQ-binding-like beta-propeller repeat protein [Chloroflexi bacterium]|nr:PQQ-binding-like beta-propeller repeat protein [Chloroflexota bacterium]